MTVARPLRQSEAGRAASGAAAWPAYDRTRIGDGVLHIGPGAFHRAHQADYFDRLLARDPRWGVTEVAMKSRGAIDALAAQDGLYTLAILDREPSFRVIGAIRELLHVHDARVVRQFLSPGLGVVTMTVTEKGYCLGADGELDLDHPDIRSDLADDARPSSVIGLLSRGLMQRRAAGLASPVLLCCDNLPANGRKLRAALVRYAEAAGTGLAGWIEDEVSVPCTMVDSITPATDDALRARVREQTGYDDLWPIQREAFTSWVIEDTGRPLGPDLESVGAVLTTDVAGHEQAKLRLLNGAHSALAYLGLSRGDTTVAGAMANPELVRFVADLMEQEIAPGLRAPQGLDLADYCASLLSRFANPAIEHRLSQIAWDGSKKLPIRLLPTLSENLAAGRPTSGLFLAVAAWMRLVRRSASAGESIVDPVADRLLRTGADCNDNPAHDVGLFLGLAGVFPPELAGRADVRDGLAAAYARVIASETRTAGGQP